MGPEIPTSSQVMLMLLVQSQEFKPKKIYRLTYLGAEVVAQR